MNDLANYQYYTIMKMLSKKHTDLGNGRERGGGRIQPAYIGWPTGNRKKLSSTQAQLGQATCWAVV